MNVLVCPHNLKIGGSPINAIDLATAVRDLGHRVVIFSSPGPLEDLVSRRDLTLVPSPAMGNRFPPSPRVVRALRRAVRREGIDLVHAYERALCLEAFYGPHLVDGVPMVGTVMAMSVPPYTPPSIPLIVGTQSLKERVQRGRPGRVELMEPPVDTESDNPSVDGSAFAEEFGVDGSALNVVVVSRLEPVMKLDGLERAIGAVCRLAPEMPVRLVMVGTGPCFSYLERRAEAANAELGRRVVILTGPLLDPRPAYAVADIVVGMGSSLLRGMALQKPAIVLGKGGFSEIVGPETIDRFLREGFYGVHDDGDHEHLYRQIRRLAEDAGERRELGLLSRELVCERFGLNATARWLEAMYRDVATGRASRARLMREGVLVGARVLRFRAGQLRRRHARGGR